MLDDFTRPLRRVALQERAFIEGIANAIDPASTQGDVESLRWRHRREPRSLLVNEGLDAARIVEEITGRKPGTFAEWVKEHAEAFAGD